MDLRRQEKKCTLSPYRVVWANRFGNVSKLSNPSFLREEGLPVPFWLK